MALNVNMEGHTHHYMSLILAKDWQYFCNKVSDLIIIVTIVQVK